MNRNRHLQVPQLVGKNLCGRQVLISIQKLLGTKQHFWKNKRFVSAVRKLMRRLRVFQRHVDALLPTPVPESTVGTPYSFDNGILRLGTKEVAILCFGEKGDDIWFKAKEIHDELGAKHITHTLG